MQIAMYGVAPFFWLPIMARIGRRPVLLISVLVSGACNVAGAYCTTYGTQMATRCITAFFIAPPVALGGVVVTDIFFQHQRGTKTGLWKLMFTLGAPGGPFIMGFVATHAGLKWTFLTFAIVNFAEFVAYLFFGPETMYVRQDQPSHQEYPASSLWQVHRFATEKFSVWELLKPFTLCTQPRIIIPICVYAIVFAYANIGIIIMYPVAYGEKFGEGPQGIGLQFIGMIVGLLIGEQIGGRGSDLWMQKRSLKLGTRVIADRLWLSYFAFVCVIIGLVVWGVSIQQARPLHWTVIPDVGAGIASCGNQIITTVLVTYAIDINPSRAAGTGLLLNFIRQTWGFIGPFYYPDMFGNLGFGGAAGLMAGIVALFGALPIIFIHRSGSRKAVHSTVA